jgi:hypothetical protein
MERCCAGLLRTLLGAMAAGVVSGGGGAEVLELQRLRVESPGAQAGGGHHHQPPPPPIDPGFVSVTVDYMPGVGVLDLDLEDPQLLAYARGLGPGLLWLGGSASCDATVFAANRSDCAAALAAGAPGARGSAFVCKGPPAHCLLAERWAAWLRFGNRTGLR